MVFVKIPPTDTEKLFELAICLEVVPGRKKINRSLQCIKAACGVHISSMAWCGSPEPKPPMVAEMMSGVQRSKCKTIPQGASVSSHRGPLLGGLSWHEQLENLA